jgi:uncharacterized protein
MRIIILSGIKLDLGEKEDLLTIKAAASLKIKQSEIKELEIIRKAIDARRSRPPHFVYVLKIVFSSSVKLPRELDQGIQIIEEDVQEIPRLTPARPPKLPVVVIGSGPAGLFAAYILSLRGIPSLILERGEPVEKRVKDVERFWQEGFLNIQSNVCFGEGGAGTFSDGKLTSRSRNPYSSWVKKILVEAGAPPEILIDTKPHVGTDKLRKVIVNLRKNLIEMGCRIKFNTQATDFIIEQETISAVIINGKEEIRTNHAILAIGQSADDTYVKLYERDLQMEAKPFAMGLRVEHPQELINSIQYGKWRNHQQLTSAEYFVKASLPDLNRSVYTFCMCPGGSIIGCSAFAGSLITNGMSNYKRSGEFANSAIVVNVRVDDFTSGGQPLDGLRFRQLWERKAFVAGGGDYRAPAQKTTDFLKNKASSNVGRTSFLPGVKPAALEEMLPEFVTNSLKRGIKEFDKKMFGFITEESHLIGVETRTSSPVRICRGKDGQSSNIRGLYPCGEGAGYAGGIISSALDGINSAQNLINHLTT